MPASSTGLSTQRRRLKPCTMIMRMMDPDIMICHLLVLAPGLVK